MLRLGLHRFDHRIPFTACAGTRPGLLRRRRRTRPLPRSAAARPDRNPRPPRRIRGLIDAVDDGGSHAGGVARCQPVGGSSIRWNDRRGCRCRRAARRRLERCRDGIQCAPPGSTTVRPIPNGATSCATDSQNPSMPTRWRDTASWPPFANVQVRRDMSLHLRIGAAERHQHREGEQLPGAHVEAGVGRVAVGVGSQQRADPCDQFPPAVEAPASL